MLKIRADVVWVEKFLFSEKNTIIPGNSTYKYFGFVLGDNLSGERIIVQLTFLVYSNFCPVTAMSYQYNYVVNYAM